MFYFNIKSQTKLTYFFLISAFVILLIWNRGDNSKNDDNEDEDNDEDILIGSLADHNKKEVYDPEKIIHRSKREQISTRLNSVYSQFQAADQCCAVPALISQEALEVCNNRRVAAQNKKGTKNKAIRTNNGLFAAIQSIFPVQNNNKNKVQKQGSKVTVIKKKKAGGKNKNSQRGKRQTKAAKRIALSVVCYTDCVFYYSKYINDSAMDLTRVDDDFTSRVSNTWKPVVQDCIYTCEEPAACATPELIPVNNKYCSIKPTILMNCLRKQMYLNCPSSARSTDYQCNSVMASLKALNTLSLT